MPCLQHDRVKIGSSSLDVDAWKIKAPPFDFTSFILTRWWEQKVSVVIIVWESFLTRFQVCSDFQNTILEFHEKKNIIEAHFRMTDESSVPSIVSCAPTLRIQKTKSFSMDKRIFYKIFNSFTINTGLGSQYQKGGLR